jgi:ribosomal protein S1
VGPGRAPVEYFHVGDEVEVKVLKFDADSGADLARL